MQKRLLDLLDHPPTELDSAGLAPAELDSAGLAPAELGEDLQAGAEPPATPDEAPASSAPPPSIARTARSHTP
jgi:hypothetical protein